MFALMLNKTKRLFALDLWSFLITSGYLQIFQLTHGIRMCLHIRLELPLVIGSQVSAF